MTSDGNLSTEDLAQPTGVRGDDSSTREEYPSNRTADTTSGMHVGSGTAGAGSWGEPGAPGPVGGEAETDPLPAGTASPMGGGPSGAAPVAGEEPSGSFGQTRGTETGRGTPGDGTEVALLDPADGERFRQRWSDVQARFVDDPQEAVQTADGLVAELMQSLAQGFSQHKGRLESQWQQGGSADTEELRRALQMYRSFFNRLLAT